jgi:hypothetical protein
VGRLAGFAGQRQRGGRETGLSMGNTLGCRRFFIKSGLETLPGVFYTVAEQGSVMSFSVSEILRRTAQSRPRARTFAALAVSILGIVVVGYLLLFAASFSPEEKLRQNVTAAHSRVFFSENYPQYFYLRPLFGRLDMYTECVGIGIASNMRPNDLLRMPTFGDCPGLTKAVENNFVAPTYDYMRFSHGHQIFLKPLYAFFSLETTRAITALTTFVLLLALFFVLKFRLDAAYAAVVALSFFFTSSPSMFFTVTHGVPFWLVLAGAITATLWDGKTAPLCLFACMGACDAFLNFFVMCSLSLALPLLCYVLAQWAKGEASDQVIANAFWGCVGWSIGFVAPWLIKWAMLQHFKVEFSLEIV